MRKNFLKGKKLIIFDMDGTLIDSLGVWNEIDSKVVDRIRGDGLTTKDNMQEIRNDALRVFATSPNPYVEYCNFLTKKYKSTLSNEEVYALRYEIADNLIANKIEYKPFAPEFIKKLKREGYLLAIGSSAQRKNINIYRTRNKNVMDKAKLDDYFDLIIARDDCVEIKPHPEVFIKILSTLGVEAKDALVFEDSLVGVEASRRAGIECCVVYDKYSDHEREEINAIADHIIDSFEELL